MQDFYVPDNFNIPWQSKDTNADANNFGRKLIASLMQIGYSYGVWESRW